MRRLKCWLRRLFCLPAIPTVLLCVPPYLLVLVVLQFDLVSTPLAYVAYALSAYAFALTCTGVYRLVLLIKNAKLPLFLRQWLATPIVQRWRRDERFRAQLALWRGAAINLLYVGVKLYYGIVGRSAWFVTLAGYYLLLFLMRAALLRLFQTGGTRAAALRRVRLCGLLLLSMNLFLTGMVVHIVRGGKGFVYSGNLIYIMAIYAFYAVGRAVEQVIRYGRRKEILLTAVKGLDFIAALVSMLALETAMIAAFSNEDADFRRLMTGISGGLVCLFALILALYMIVYTTRELRRETNKYTKEL